MIASFFNFCSFYCIFLVFQFRTHMYVGATLSSFFKYTVAIYFGPRLARELKFTKLKIGIQN
jgi:hypothetical protein